MHTFPLIRVSYPLEQLYLHNIRMPIPRAWYRIVGTRDSNESLIIMLLNDPNDSKDEYKVNCSIEDSRWKPIFEDLIAQDNVILCKLDQMMIMKSEYEAILPEDGIENPGELVIRELFENK